jgi:hypothetical protein
MCKALLLRTCCIILSFFLLTAFLSCRDAVPVESPPGYDLANPQKFIMGNALHEISGIVFLPGNDDSLYAIEDEDGKLFYFHPGDGKYNKYQSFGKRGDYEDVAVLGNTEFAVLRSDGSLFVFPVSLLWDGDKTKVRIYEHILPAGEYEGLYGDKGGKLFALCKNCPEDDQREAVSGYILQKDKDGNLAVSGGFKVDVSGVKLKGSGRKSKFRPSCLAKHPLTGEWYIISSVNKILLVLDDQWKVKATYPLDPGRFKQPEGLAFDRAGNMYISNEGQEGNANVLLFTYRQPK